MANSVTMYGADWCGDTRRSRAVLSRLSVSYDYVDLEQDAKASEWVKSQHAGKEKKPTIMVGKRMLTEPSDGELEQALRDEGVLPESKTADMVTDGAGG